MSNAALPFLKWAGGKRWLACRPDLPLPKVFGRYIEPFLGGGAMFFRLQPKQAILSDINADLINAYLQIKLNVEAVKKGLDAHQFYHSKDHYYFTRDTEPHDEVEAAVKFIYLNRTCWNGLYRVNRQGKFNVPLGTKTVVSYKDGELEAVSRSLNHAQILCHDFQQSIDTAVDGDFVFIDPPYTANHNLNGFLKYNENIFSWADQQRLKAAVSSAINRGVKIAVTNADHESVRDLYNGVGTYKQIWRASVLAGKASQRGQRSEALFTANF